MGHFRPDLDRYDCGNFSNPLLQLLPSASHQSPDVCLPRSTKSSLPFRNSSRAGPTRSRHAASVARTDGGECEEAEYGAEEVDAVEAGEDKIRTRNVCSVQ